MRFVFFCQSILSDWNHGNAHFLRGVVVELMARGHDVHVYEPRDGWSIRNLLDEHGQEPLEAVAGVYPGLPVTRYEPATLDVAQATDGADVVIVHEWNDPEVVSTLGRQREARKDFLLLFHDTHHRSVSAPEEMDRYDLSHYDGVLAYGEAVREAYGRRGLGARTWIWHEAADTRVFRPIEGEPTEADLVWVGNWADGERSTELGRFVLRPVRELGLRASAWGVRYPEDSVRRLHDAGVHYRGWLPNYDVPRVFARHRVTVHVPRSWYVERLPGIPTIRPFEALACGIPLVCTPWEDRERLFRPGADYLVARNPVEMQRHLYTVLHDPELAAALSRNGLERIRSRHTCVHRVDELLALCRSRGIPRATDHPPNEPRTTSQGGFPWPA